MKKFLSMILVLTFIVTTLMSVMVMDVSASEYACTVDEATGERTWTLTMSKNGNFKQNIATGKYIVKPSVQHANGLAEYDLGKIEQVPNLGKTYWHIDFDAIDYYKEGSTDTTNVLAAGNYVRFRTDIEDSTGKTPGTKTELSSLTPAEFNAAVGGNTVEGVTTYGGMVKYTFYAYSKDKNATPFSVQFSNPSSSLSSVDLSASKLYSEKGIPHKVDMYVWSDSKDATVIGDKKNTASKEKIYYSVVVDGVTVLTKASYAENKTNAYKATKFCIAPFVHFAPTTNAEYSFKGSDWYVSHDGNLSHKLVTRENADDATFMNITVPDAGGDLKLTKKSDNITGVEPWVDTALEAAVLVAVNGNDRSVKLYEKYYNNPARIFTGEETNVKLIDRTTGAEVAVADATGTMDDYYFMVNGIYIIPNKVADPEPAKPYEKAKGVAFNTTTHNGIVTRTKHEDYYNNDYTDEKTFGGMTKNFYRFTNEPRSSVGFSGGVVKYDDNGYVAMRTYASTSSQATDESTAKLSNYNVEKNIATLEWDMYIPEYTPNGNYYRVNIAGYDGGWATSNRKNEQIYFITDGIKGDLDSNYVVDLPANTWNTVSLAFDMTGTAASENGEVICRAYVNGQLQKTFTLSVGNYKDEAQTMFFPFAYLRFYSPKYTAFGVTRGAWYMGDYTPTATPVSTSAITSADANVTVDEANLLIASKYATEEELVASLKGYVPIYSAIIDSAVVDAKYDEVDGKITEKESGDNVTATGIIIKRLCEMAGWFDVTEDAETGKKIYTKKENTSEGIIEAVDNGDRTATLTFTKTYSFVDTVEGAYMNVDTILANYPELKTQELIGFAVVDEGCLPKVYSLAPNGLALRTLSYDTVTNTATLNYREFGGTDTIPFVMVVAAYDAKGKMLAMDVSDIITINSASEADGVKTKTFTADFGELDLTTVRKYKVFAFNSFAERKPIMTNYSMINPAYVAPVE